MQNRILPRLLAPVVIAGLLLAVRALGYVVYTDDSGVYVIKWQSSPITMQVMLSSTANLQDGTSQRSSVAAAMEFWNTKLGTVQFASLLSSPGVYHAGNGVNEIVMDSTLDGDTFPAGALAITLRYTQGDMVEEDDIVFNTAYTWNSYRGNLQTGKEDIRRVALHELGHVLGLDHPDEHGQGVTALMNSHESNLDTLQADDIAGAQFLYGAPGVKPANDDFSEAAQMPDASYYGIYYETVATGSNIGGSREDGEPDHAGTPQGHSVWWKWTAPIDSVTTISTGFSNFDTVLGVYTGTAVSALTEIASNDDEETVEENPTPQRIRTSLVSFNAVGGTTYYIAVDGFADADFHGYTGQIRLQIQYTELVPPTIIGQPEDQTVDAGQVASFAFFGSAKPSPTFEWQRRVAGGEWTPVSDGGAYSISSFSSQSSLQVTASPAMDGDQFRCVMSNPGGSVTTDIVTLHVNSIPLPKITVQPQGGAISTGVAGGLSVTASGATGYQWYHDGSPVSGATKSELWLDDPQPADAGEYYVVATNAQGSTTSDTVVLTLLALPVVTNLSAPRQVIDAGGMLSCSISASGKGELSYQWYHDGRPIRGATSDDYTQAIHTQQDAGAYWVAVTDENGTRYGAPFFAILAHPFSEVVGWGDGVVAQQTAAANPSLAVALAAANDTGVVVTQDGTVVTWGLPNDRIFSTVNDAVAVAACSDSALALRSDGTVVGINTYVENVPADLTKVAAVACTAYYGAALRTDGTVVTWGVDAPFGHMDHIAAIASGYDHLVVLKMDGTILDLGQYNNPTAEPISPGTIPDAISVSAGLNHSLALKADGTVVAWGDDSWGQTDVPAGLHDVVGIAAGDYHSLALRADGTVVEWGNRTERSVPGGLDAVFAVAASNASFVLRDTTAGEAPLVTLSPQSWSVPSTFGSANLTAVAAGDPAAELQWQFNGQAISGANESYLSVEPFGPQNAGLYSFQAILGGNSHTSEPAILGYSNDNGSKVLGDGQELQPTDIRHPNGNIFDQVLLTGVGESIVADPGQVTRTSFIDLNDDIVQVEFSGSGTLSLVLDAPSGPARPVNYTQAVDYMKGHAGIVISGADGTTNVSVFTVGRATAFDPTGAYNILQVPGAANNPAKNGSPLFTGHTATHYDGIAGIAFIAILSDDGEFGGIRAANAHFFANQGLTGVYAPDVRFLGPVYLGDVTAYDDATAVIRLGSADDVRITGGDLLQDASTNGRHVQVSGITQLKFTAGSDSGGNVLPALQNKAVLEENGEDVTSQIVVNPTP